MMALALMYNPNDVRLQENLKFAETALKENSK
jgi:hypothetical protein